MIPLALTATAQVALAKNSSTENSTPAYFPQTRLSSQVSIKGHLTQGGMIIGKAPAGSQVSLDNVPLRITNTGHFVFGFGRDQTGQTLLQVTPPQGNTNDYPLTIEKRVFDIQHINGIAKKIMQPSADDSKRAGREQALVGKARRTDSSLLAFLADFTWPLLGPITGVYGSQRVFNGEPKRPHYGIDIAAPTGTPVKAPASGTITMAHPDMFYSGGTLIIDHGFGVSSTFIHLSKLYVEEGQTIRKGEYVAEVGAGGRATGPHLDWRINWYQTRLDPALIMRPMPGNPPR